jgi:hypothetical protein
MPALLPLKNAMLRNTASLGSPIALYQMDTAEEIDKFHTNIVVPKHTNKPGNL